MRTGIVTHDVTHPLTSPTFGVIAVSRLRIQGRCQGARLHSLTYCQGSLSQPMEVKHHGRMMTTSWSQTQERSQHHHRHQDACHDQEWQDRDQMSTQLIIVG